MRTNGRNRILRWKSASVCDVRARVFINIMQTKVMREVPTRRKRERKLYPTCCEYSKCDGYTMGRYAYGACVHVYSHIVRVEYVLHLQFSE